MPPNCTRRALGRNVAQILRVELTTGNHGLPRKERYGYNLSCFFFLSFFMQCKNATEIIVGVFGSVTIGFVAIE